MKTFDYRFAGMCDAASQLTGRRCSLPAMSKIPNIISEDGHGNSEQRGYVCLCSVHYARFQELKMKNKRLRLRRGGWLGAYNKHFFGSCVFDRGRVDWSKPQYAGKVWASREVEFWASREVDR